MNKTTTATRIEYLDGLRCVSILAVIAYHYFARWTPPLHDQNLYPYGERFTSIARFGFLGVQLFFVISGFVIALTLRRCTTWIDFAVRRFARLWPTMALCSLLTFLVLTFVPSPFATSAHNFLPALTFIHPEVWNAFAGSPLFRAMDGAYWSLFVEVRFYVLMALLYFLQTRRFERNLVIAGALIIAGYTVADWLHLKVLGNLLETALIANYVPWFLIGIALYLRDRWGAALAGLGALGILFEGMHEHSLWVAGLLVAAIVLAAERWRPANRLLSAPLIAGVGRASYSLYLLHQLVGVTLIVWLCRLWHLTGSPAVFVAVAVWIFITTIACLIFKGWETPLNRWIVQQASPGARRSVQAPNPESAT